jgi:apolipoprotein N-acyltransferase
VPAMLALSFGATWLAFFLTCAAPPRSPMLRTSKVFLAIAFAWLAVEVIRYGMVREAGGE